MPSTDSTKRSSLRARLRSRSRYSIMSLQMVDHAPLDEGAVSARSHRVPAGSASRRRDERRSPRSSKQPDLMGTLDSGASGRDPELPVDRDRVRFDGVG